MIQEIRRIGQLTLILSAMALALTSCGGQPTTSSGSGDSQGSAVEERARQFWADSVDNGSFLMGADDVKAALDAGEDLFLLDVRLAEHYDEQGHIPGAVNIPYPEVGDNLDRIPTDKKVVVICYTGHWAGNTSAVLRTLGYDTYNMRFGMSAWHPDNNSLLTLDKTPSYPKVNGTESGSWE